MIQYIFRIKILSKATLLASRDGIGEKNERDNEFELLCSMSKSKYD